MAPAPSPQPATPNRSGLRFGQISELTVIVPLKAGKDGAERLRQMLAGGTFSGADAVGTVHDMRFVILDNDTKLLFATAYDGDWDSYITDFATKIPDAMDHFFSVVEGWPGIQVKYGQGLYRPLPGSGNRMVCRVPQRNGRQYKRPP